MDNERSVGQGFEELRADLKGFLETRYEILRAELSSGMKKARSGAVLLGAAAAFALVGLMLLSTCVALAIGLAFGAFMNQVGLVWGFLVTGAGSLILAGITAAAGKARLQSVDLVPQRTLRVLKRDGQALQQQGGDYGESEPSAERRRA